MLQPAVMRVNGRSALGQERPLHRDMIRVLVLDRRGEPMPGVKVEAIAPSERQKFEAKTDERGMAAVIEPGTSDDPLVQIGFQTPDGRVFVYGRRVLRQPAIDPGLVHVFHTDVELPPPLFAPRELILGGAGLAATILSRILGSDALLGAGIALKLSAVASNIARRIA